MNDFVALLGEDLHSSRIRRCVATFDEEADVFDDGVDLYHSFPRNGVTLVFRGGRLDSVMFYSEGRDSFSQYGGGLPFGLLFTDSGTAVQQKVEREVAGSGRVRVPFPGRSESNWMKFTFENWTLHVEFKSQALDAISLVTVAMRGIDSSN